MYRDLKRTIPKPINLFRAHGHHSIDCSHIFTMTESFVDDINLLDNYCSEVVQNLFQDLQELLSTSQRALFKKDDLLIVPDNARVFAEAVPKVAKSGRRKRSKEKKDRWGTKSKKNVTGIMDRWGSSSKKSSGIMDRCGTEISSRSMKRSSSKKSSSIMDRWGTGNSSRSITISNSSKKKKKSRSKKDHRWGSKSDSRLMIPMRKCLPSLDSYFCEEFLDASATTRSVDEDTWPFSDDESGAY